MKKTVRTLLLTLAVFAGYANASEEKLIEVSSGSEIPVTVFPSMGEPKLRLIWLPSEYGIHGRESQTARQIADQGIEVWLADLHGTYFMPFGRSSFNKVPVNDISELILEAASDDVEPVLFATGRAAPLALTAVNQLQQDKKTRDLVKRAVLMHPNFFARTTNVGEKVSYLPVVDATDLAIYIIQPEMSGKAWQLNDLKSRLEKSGSDVVIQKLPGVADGYNIREPESDNEAAMYKRTPSLVSNAVKLLQFYIKPRHAAAMNQQAETKNTNPLKTGLQPYNGNITTPYLNFKDLEGKLHTLENHRNQVLLLNFWASWCPPCVKELPSLTRLQRKFPGTQFTILAINIGEDSETVKKFLKPMDIAFPVLADSDGESVSHWNLVAFPSSFVLDKTGKIRYGLFGGLEWDNPEVVRIVQQLIRE